MPLLAGAELDPEHRVQLAMKQPCEQLPLLSVTDSSEAMLPGRKSTFRLMICAVHAEDGTPLDVRPLLSPAFVVRVGVWVCEYEYHTLYGHTIERTYVPTVITLRQVATRRIKGNIKEDFPTVDDPVGKLEHIGKQTEEKLRDLLGAAANCGLDLMMPMMPAEWRTSDGTTGIPAAVSLFITCITGKVSINTVGQFRRLMQDAESDTQLRKQLQQVRGRVHHCLHTWHA